MRSGWKTAMTLVLKYNQVAVAPQAPDDLEMGSLNENENSVTAAASASKSRKRLHPALSSNRGKTDIRWPQRYGGRRTRRHDMLAIEEEDEIGTSEALVVRAGGLPFNQDSVSSSNRQINLASCASTPMILQDIENEEEIEELNSNSECIAGGIEMSFAKPSSSAANIESNLDSENSDGCATLKDKLSPELINMYYKDSRFTTFCRTELINKLLEVNDSSEIKYFQLLQQLFILENAISTTGATSSDYDIFAALFNRWLLVKKNQLKRKCTSVEEEYKLDDHASLTNKKGTKDLHTFPKEITRRAALQNLLSNVSHKRQYLIQLRKLYDLERRDLGELGEFVF